MELESKPFVIDTAKWKNELKCNGFILCDKESCQMGFLSLRGMEVHRQKCVGHVNEGVSIHAFCLQCVSNCTITSCNFVVYIIFL